MIGDGRANGWRNITESPGAGGGLSWEFSFIPDSKLLAIEAFIAPASSPAWVTVFAVVLLYEASSACISSQQQWGSQVGFSSQ